MRTGTGRRPWPHRSSPTWPGCPRSSSRVGSAEVLLDDSVRLAERAEAAGVDVTLKVWEEMFHVWHAFAEMLPEGMEATRELAEWVDARLA